MSGSGVTGEIGRRTPRPIENRAGLSRLSRRIGGREDFLAGMLARLDGRTTGLATRSPEDGAVAIMDLAATMLDVVSFYTDLTAQEHYLGTATERRALIGLAALTGAGLGPGRSAETLLSFEIEPRPVVEGAAVPGPGELPREPIIPAGTRVQSVPLPGQKPVIFETLAPLAARAEWNAAPLALSGTAPANPVAIRSMRFAAPPPTLRAGMRAFVESGGAIRLATVSAIAQDMPGGAATITLDTGSTLTSSDPNRALTTFADPGAVVGGGTLDTLAGQRVRQAEVEALGDKWRWDMDAIAAGLMGRRAASASGPVLGWLGTKAALFGHNGVDMMDRPYEGGRPAIDIVWALPIGGIDFDVWWQGAPSGSVDLDGPVSAAVEGARIAFEWATGAIVATVSVVTELSRDRFKLKQRVTRVTLTDIRVQQADGSFAAGTTSAIGGMPLADTQVSIETGRATSLAVPLAEAMSASVSRLALDRPMFGLHAGRPVIVTGISADRAGVALAEAATIADIELDGGGSALVLARPLANRYLRSTVRVLANCARVTHGESVAEVMGSGDGRKTFQQFTLRQSPLSWRSASTPSGVEPAIEVRVDGAPWKRVETLADAGPEDRVYIIATALDGGTVIGFGNGVRGARLPTGSENVTAHYQRGLGILGLLQPGQLSLMLDRPLGVRSVTNPLPATGGAEPEAVADARRSLPMPLRTIGRAITLDDYADFAAASAGVGKARADWVAVPHGRAVLVTVAAADGTAFDPATPVFDGLLEALREAGDPNVTVLLAPHRPRSFDLDATLTLAPDTDKDMALAFAAVVLATRFGFSARDFARPLYPSEIVAALQSVPGVAGVDLNALWDVTGPVPGAGAPPAAITVAGPALSASGQQLGAELLTLSTQPLGRLTAA